MILFAEDILHIIYNNFEQEIEFRKFFPKGCFSLIVAHVSNCIRYYQHTAKQPCLAGKTMQLQLKSLCVYAKQHYTYPRIYASAERKGLTIQYEQHNLMACLHSVAM